jgi:hypothetical protein
VWFDEKRILHFTRKGLQQPMIGLEGKIAELKDTETSLTETKPHTEWNRNQAAENKPGAQHGHNQSHANPASCGKVAETGTQKRDSTRHDKTAK